MNVREAIKVLADGGKVVDCDGNIWTIDESDLLVHQDSNGAFTFRSFAPFTLHVEPASDEELIAEMERLRMSEGDIAYAHCANLLRTRKVKP